MVSRASEVDKIQQLHNQQAQIAQHHLGVRMRAEIERKQNQVQNSPKSGKIVVDRDGKRRGNQQGQHEKPSVPTEPADTRKTSQGQKAPDRGGLLDIEL